jgi:hypothetical protein
VDVPSEQEGGVTTQSNGPDEGFPGWFEEELDEGYYLEEKGQDESQLGGYFREYRK